MRSVVIVLLLVIPACNKHQPQGAKAAASPARVNLRRAVELAQARQQTIVAAIDQVGTLEPRQMTEIAAGVSGIVDEVLFDEGLLVDPADAQPLVLIDKEKYQRAFEAAAAAEKRALANYARAKDIFDRAETSGVAAAESERRQANESMNAAEADLQAATANLKLARHNIERSRVRPPYRGQINSRRVAPGSYVKEDTIIATIADLSEIRLVGYVPESAAPMIRLRMEQRPVIVAARTAAVLLAGANAGWGGVAANLLAASGEVPSGFDPEFTVPSLPRRTFRATIFYMSTVADPTTHMFECKARLDPRDPAFALLKPGYTARIRFPYESTADAVVVPEEAVRATERGFLVFLVERKAAPDGSVEWVARSQKVDVGARSPGWVEIRAGITSGQWIVQRGAEALDDGVPVRIPEAQARLLKP